MLPPGHVIDGRYEIVGPLGTGGMGQIYRARRVRLGDDVALKMLLSPDADAEARERFLRESRASAQLRHPHVVSILDFDTDAEGRPFLVMELLSGPSLREELDVGGAFGPARTAEVLRVVASAVQLAHDHGVTHRDLKPANIVAHRFESGERVYKVIDFGLASLQAPPDATRLTLPFTFLGTIAYSAPEQLAGETVGPAADQYSLAVVAYELLTGRRPFDAADPLALAQQVLSAGPAPASTVVPDLPAAADAVLARAMARAPAERWESVAAFVEALAGALAVPDEARDGGALDEVGLLSRYDLGEVLGPGRLGSIVRRGAHRALSVPVAIRHLRREGQAGWDALRARFLQEARTLQVRHPHLLHVRDYGEDSTGVFVVTDLVDGPSLRAVLAGGPLEWPRARRLILQMIDAAGALHRHGGLLTGVNPDTIRVTGDADAEHVVLTSGGIRSLQDVLATMRESELRGQEASEVELPYLAPEVLTGRTPEPPADLFTLGAIAYELATGRRPFNAPTLPELIGAMLTSGAGARPAVAAPSTAGPAIERCLVADPSARGTLADLAAAVRASAG
ncbi:MAG: serine/threonine-protein kinase [Vicinamibacterales bacterium]